VLTVFGGVDVTLGVIDILGVIVNVTVGVTVGVLVGVIVTVGVGVTEGTGGSGINAF